MMKFASLKKSLRGMGVRVGSNALFFGGALALLQRRRDGAGENGRKSHPFAILLYHRVNPDNDPFFAAVPVEVFDAQMNYLARNFKVRALADIVDKVRRGNSIDPLTIAITFDDGYRDNFTYAHPILRKYGLPATIFVATGYVGTDDLMWNDRLAWAIKTSGRKKFLGSIAESDFVLPLHTDSERFAALEFLLAKLKALQESAKEMTLEHFMRELGANGPEPRGLMLDWPALRRMASEGWTIGSHTVHHQILTKVDPHCAREELRISKAVIEGELQCHVTLCAFPNGKQSDFDANIKALVKELGYQAALTTLPGVNHSSSDLYELRRRSVWEDHLPTLACKLGYSYWRGSDHEERA